MTGKLQWCTSLLVIRSNCGSLLAERAWLFASFRQSSSTIIERASFLWDEVSEANPLKKYGCLVKRFVYHYHAKLLEAFFFESWLLGKVASKKVWSGDSWGEAPNNIRFSTRKRGTKNLAWKTAYRVLTVAIWASCLRSLTWGSCESLIGLSSGPKQFLNLSPLIIAHSTGLPVLAKANTKIFHTLALIGIPCRSFFTVYAWAVAESSSNQVNMQKTIKVVFRDPFTPPPTVYITRTVQTAHLLVRRINGDSFPNFLIVDFNVEAKKIWWNSSKHYPPDSAISCMTSWENSWTPSRQGSVPPDCWMSTFQLSSSGKMIFSTPCETHRPSRVGSPGEG